MIPEHSVREEERERERREESNNGAVMSDFLL